MRHKGTKIMIKITIIGLLILFSHFAGLICRKSRYRVWKTPWYRLLMNPPVKLFTP